MLRFRVRLFHC
uniref:Uncharacterized protein n=1 Tax=Lepeophtheirus salmonis TaxID=72036 RepID=A0A0K2TZH2_LEPSM